MTSDWSFFVEFQNYFTDIYLINEKLIKATENSKVKLFVNREKLTLNDILYMLELNRNLLLIETVSSHNITVKFLNKKTVFQYNERVIATVN